MSVEENTIKYSTALVEELLPKMKNLTLVKVTVKENGEEVWHKPQRATMQEKLKLLNAIAERQAKLQEQNEWMAERKEYYRKIRGE